MSLQSITISAPARASASAVSRPMPRLHPVMATILPRKSPRTGHSTPLIQCRHSRKMTTISKTHHMLFRIIIIKLLPNANMQIGIKAQGLVWLGVANVIAIVYLLLRASIEIYFLEADPVPDERLEFSPWNWVVFVFFVGDMGLEFVT
jgi:hypothetical protein